MILLTDIDKQFIVNVILSVILGYMIGFERESRKKEAGIRTHIFVILGAMLFTTISKYIEPNLTARIASQVVVGIGFLGAGLIIREKNKIRNLTTAASIWFSAGIGMAIGFGFYFISVLSTFVALIALRISVANK